MVKHTDPRGFPYYWLHFGGIVQTSGHDTDLEAIADGYVAVTPLHLDLTYREALESLAASY
jgi:5'-nucleotidase